LPNVRRISAVLSFEADVLHSSRRVSLTVQG